MTTPEIHTGPDQAEPHRQAVAEVNTIRTPSSLAAELGYALFSENWIDGPPTGATPAAHDAAIHASEMGREHALLVVWNFLRALAAQDAAPHA